MVQFHLIICATVFLEVSSCCIIMYLDCSILILFLVWVAQKLIVDSNLNGFQSLLLQVHPWFDIIHSLFCFISEK